MKKLTVLVLLILSLVMTACAPSESVSGGNQDSEATDVQGEQVGEELIVPEEPVASEEPEEPEIYEDLPVPEEPKYLLTVEGVTLENGENLKAFEFGESVTLVAQDKEDAVFLYWQENGSILTNAKTLSVTVESDRFIKAVYAEKSQGELEFNTEDGKTYYVAGMGSVSGDTLIIPDTYNSKPVTKIAMTAFKDNTQIKTVVIPDTVTSIGKNAFSGCTSLEYISIPSSVEKIEANEFSDCTSLKTVALGINMDISLGINSVQTVFITEGVEKINFEGLKNVKAVFLPESVKEIDDNAFKNCASLIKVNIPEGIESIGDMAFYGCHSLGNIDFPESLKEIGKYAFFQCRSMTELNLPQLLSMDDGAFEACKGISSLTLPDSLLTLPEYAFTECVGLTRVTLGINATEIGKSAFKNCERLTDIALPDTLMVIGGDAFKGCVALSDISLPHNVVEMGAGVFEDCSALTKISLPERLYEIDTDAFRNCTSLREITVCVNTKKAEMGAFNGVDKFNATVYYNGTQSEWEKSFAGASAFEEMVMKFQANTHYDFDSGLRYTSNGDGTCHIGRIDGAELTVSELIIPEKSPKGDIITHIDKDTFNSNQNIKTLVIEAPLKYIPTGAFSSCSKLVSVTLPETVEIIDDTAFANCYSLTSINLPEGVRIIGARAFDYCQSIESLVLPTGLEVIGESAFTGCKSLKEVTLGEKVKSVDRYAFSFCQSLEKINMNCVDTVFGSSVFTTNSNASVYYGKGLEGWLSLDMKFGLLSNGMKLFIDGAELTEVVIPESVTEIKEYAFSNVKSLKKVVFHDGVKKVGGGAFNYCSGLEEIILPEGLTQIETGAFAHCDRVSRIVIPASVTYMSEYAFTGTGFDEIYYNGTRDDWYSVNSLKKSGLGYTVIWYSEEQPTAKGYYWRWVDSQRVKW